MKSLLLPSSLAAALLLGPLAQADVFINEVLGSTTSSDSEFIELYNSGGTAVDITGWTVEIYESDAGGSFGSLDNSTTIGTASIGAGDHFLLGSPQFTTDFGITPDEAIANNFLENSSYTLILRDAAMTIVYSAFVTDGGAGDGANDAGTPITPDFSIGPDGTFIPAGYALTPDGGTASVMLEYSPKPAPSATPGAANPLPGGALTLVLDTNSISEEGTTSINATVSTSTPVSGDLNVTVTISDESEASTFSTTIFDTETEGIFTIDAIDDFWPDGNQSVTVTVSAPTYDSDDDTFTVTDDDTNFLLLVNEVYYAADASLLDANGDGTPDTTEPSDDEFIEIINTSGGTLDLSGVEIFTNFGGGSAHTFPDGTTLGNGSAIVVFGGGDIAEGAISGVFGSAEIQKSSGGGLYLDDDGSESIRLVDTIGTLSGTAGGELQMLPLPDQSASPTGGSYALQTDATYTSGYALHTLIPTTTGTPYSPGTQLDGSDFLLWNTGQLVVEFNVPDVSEAAGFVAAGGTVSVPAPVASDLTVYLNSNDTGEIDAESANPVTISTGMSSANFDLYPVDELDLDGTQTVTITAHASGYLNGSNTIDVTDDDTVPYTPPNLVITEIMFNPASAEPGAEWVEIYNADSTTVNLGGVKLDDEDGTDWSTISGGSVESGKYVVLFNSAFTDESTFRTEWSVPTDAVVIGVTWGSIANSPSGTNEVVQLLDGFANVLDEVNIDDASPWPSDNNSASHALITTAYDDASNDDGANWLLSGGPGQSNAVSPAGPTFSTSDVGSPGFDGTGAPTNDFATWLSSNGYSATGFDTDSDSDGDSNGAEWYFFGSSPDVVSTNGSAVSEVSSAGGGIFIFSHRRPTSRSGVTETYEYSLNLDGTWTPSDATVTITPGATVPDGAGYEIVTVSVIVDPPTTAKVFVRLALSETP